VIGIVEYGCGNLRSLENALEALGLPCRRVSTREDVLAVERLILPGVGNFGHAGAALAASGLGPALQERAALGRPLLGICLGMQLLLQGSDEAPDVPGLGLVEGRCRLLDAPGLKVPHMGWSDVAFEGRTQAAYFVHSYCLPAWAGTVPADALGLARHGESFVAAFRQGALGGFQFHPERSGTQGLALLKEALQWS
jgi:imidazole glycerol phosphate synthase glutamine amidotransferase subunit